MSKDVSSGKMHKYLEFDKKTYANSKYSLQTMSFVRNVEGKSLLDTFNE